MKGKKESGTFGNLLFYAMIILVILGALAASTNSDERKSLFGYRAYNVLSGSMQPEIQKGSLVLVKQTEAREIEVGRDITFYSDSLNKIVTHRVVEVIPDVDGEGNPGFKTKGIGNPKPDDWIVYGKNVVGVVVGHVPYAGFVLSYIANHLLLTGGLVLLFMALCSQVSNLIGSRKKAVSENE